MLKLTSTAIFFLAAGIFTSVSILSIYQILLLAPLVYFIYTAYKTNEYKLPVSALFLGAFVLIAFLSLVINFDHLPRPSKNFSRLKYYLFAIGSIYVLKAWLRGATDRTKTILTNTFFLSMVVAGSVAIYNAVSLGGRAKGLTDTMRYGYGSAFALLVILSGLLHQKQLRKWFDWRTALIAFIFGFIGMYLTQTRGALLGFLSGIPFVLYFYKRKLGLILGGFIVLSIFSLGCFYLFGSGNYESRYLVNKNNPSDVIRRSQWKAAVIAIEEKPVLGWGLSNFHSQLKRIKFAHDLDAKDYDDAHSHNLFLEVASGTGIIGLILFLGWLITWAMEMLKSKPIKRSLIVPFGVAFVVSSQFEVTLDANNASMIFFLYALSEAAE